MIELSTEFAENLVATAVDMLSISVAYQLGINQSGFIIGFLYAVLDAYVVIWQRRRLTRLAHLVTAGLSRFTDSMRRSKSELQVIKNNLRLPGFTWHAKPVPDTIATCIGFPAKRTRSLVSQGSAVSSWISATFKLAVLTTHEGYVHTAKIQACTAGPL